MAKCSTDHVREIIHTSNFSFSTEKTYVGWLYRFIIFHNKGHPKDIDFELDEIIIRGDPVLSLLVVVFSAVLKKDL
jgi:hypothetical protein